MGNFCTSPYLQETRGVVEVVYSSTTGTSKKAADDLVAVLEENGYIAPVSNIGDYNYEDLLGYKGTIIFLLSTYGNGDSPEDGENYLKWIEEINPTNQFSELEYAILAFGNSNFERHCGFGLRSEKVLQAGGAKEILELTKCDAASKDRDVEARFPDWSKKLIEKLNATRPLVPASQTNSANPYEANILINSNFNWQEKANEQKNLSKEFSNYWNMPVCKVIHIKELRQNTADGRSTLWIRIEAHKDMHIDPACNVNIFPINSLECHPEDDKLVEFGENRGKVPFPIMPLR
jgi:sulfite reductase alpha subunit-like flavoprotein